MAKKVNKALIQELYFEVINGYLDKDENGEQLNQSVRTLDYLNAVDRLAKMHGLDTPDVNATGSKQMVIQFGL